MAVNQQTRAAVKRLAADLEEIRNSPVANVSAEPLDDDMFEWHCNFCHDGVIFHIILFFPENYPYCSPSAEFVPSGFDYAGGATRPGKKGTQVCLSIFSDFAEYHKEWANEKGMGWSPGYTVQTVLLNMVSFMADMHEGLSYSKDMLERNTKLAKKFKCGDCGHTFAKPMPPVSHEEKAGQPMQADSTPRIVDYISKITLSMTKPKTMDDLYGYGLIKSGTPHMPSLTTPCEFLSRGSFVSMKTSVGKVESTMREGLAYFLPLYIHKAHGEQIKDTLEVTMKEVAAVLPSCDPNTTPVEEIVMSVIPNLMSATVVQFSKGTQHASDNHLSGYFALHRLLLWAFEEYPALQGQVDAKLKEFIDDESKRTKASCPNIGEWLMLLAGSKDYTWQEASNAYLSESWKRNVMWYVKDDAKLGFHDTDKKYRLEKTLAVTAVSRKLLAFQVLFLDIAMPKGMSRADVISRYDNNCGFPTHAMVKEMKTACQRIDNMETYDDWFKVLKLKTPSDDEIFASLTKAVKFAITTDGYRWSFRRNQGGWEMVYKRYPQGTVGWVQGRSDDGGVGNALLPKRGHGLHIEANEQAAARPGTSGGKKGHMGRSDDGGVANALPPNRYHVLHIESNEQAAVRPGTSGGKNAGRTVMNDCADGSAIDGRLPPPKAPRQKKNSRHQRRHEGKEQAHSEQNSPMITTNKLWIVVLSTLVLLVGFIGVYFAPDFS